MKNISYFVVGLLIVSSFTAISIGQNASLNEVEQKLSTDIKKIFDNPITIEREIDQETFLEITIEGTNTVSYKSGKPLLPIYRKTIELPFATTVKSITIDKENVVTETISEKILPAPKPVLQGTESQSKPEYILDDEVYKVNAFYPDKNYDYTIGAGLNSDSNRKNFLTLEVYPVRYNPVQNKIEYAKTIDIQIEYNQPLSNPFKTSSQYDMVIIAPDIFSSELNNLVEHKNKYNVRTILKTTEEIYNQYNGRDKPEQIKYFIKDAIESYGIKHVLLVGGMTSLIDGISRDDANQGTTDWHVPVRYTNLRETGEVYDPGYISDLYYADIYDAEGNFSSWDKDINGESDGIFASWGTFIVPRKDILDLYPDVYLGRLACRNLQEVNIVVNKIIDYERYKHKTEWYDKMILIAGDSHNDPGTNYLEGELSCDYMLDNYMQEYEGVKIYASNRDIAADKTPTPDNIVREISMGAGHLLFEGHGHPGSWNTHWPGVFEWADSPGGINILQFPKLSNDGIKQPVTVVGGCHNSQFNVTLMATTLDRPYMWTHGMPVPECFSWHLVRIKNGGAIASMGNTGLGYGAVGEHGDLDGDGENLPDTLEAFGGYIIKLFYETFDEGKETVGECWGGAITKYLNTYPGMDYKIDAKTVQQWALLGDPSLKIGGYRAEEQSKSKEIDFNSRFPVIRNILSQILEFPLIRYILEKTNLNFFAFQNPYILTSDNWNNLRGR